MVGANTVIIDDPSLRKRLEPRGPRYYRVVIDGKLRAPIPSRIFSPHPPTILFTAVKDEAKIKLLASKGVKVHVVGSNGRVDLPEALRILYKEYGVERLLVEGGGSLNYSLLSLRLADELRITVTPYLFAAGVGVVHDPEGVGFRDTRESPRLKLVCSELCPCGQCIHLVYMVEDAVGEPAVSSFTDYCLSERVKALASR
jgi:2,5-diamino-6-(ribosylamino)-4(3H)-pyrimidinone 5'-phosphate reductase